ncbi:MAG: hypothetical protein M5U09_09560 [Gammaproteobacteria bacterium]|nr:hypothetical protein [Gammaproteobacteria bacterium]
MKPALRPMCFISMDEVNDDIIMPRNCRASGKVARVGVSARRAPTSAEVDSSSDVPVSINARHSASKRTFLFM